MALGGELQGPGRPHPPMGTQSMQDAVCSLLLERGLASDMEESSDPEPCPGPTVSTFRILRQAALDRKLLAKVAEEVLRHFERGPDGSLEAAHVAACAGRLYERLALKGPSDVSLYLSVTVHDSCGCNSLNREELASFLGDLLSDCVRWSPTAALNQELEPLWPLGEATPPSTPRPPPLGPPPSPVDCLRVTLRLLSGEAHRTCLPALATVTDLEAAVACSPLARREADQKRPAPQHLFAVRGTMLHEGLPLEDQGLLNGDFVEVIRATPPPARIRIECDGMGGGPSLRGSCGTFCLMGDFRKNGRPVYVRDRGLSAWNKAMAYHGDGERFLLYEDHPAHGGRWALTDDQDWSRYKDRCYAFVTGDALHPGYLEGQCWQVFRDAKGIGYSPAYLKHASLHVTLCEEEET